MASADSAAPEEGVVRLEIPAQGAYLAILRSVVGNLAGRHDFTVEEIDDLRMAVDEAASLLLDAATGPLDAMFTIGPGRVDTQLTAPTPAGFEIDRDSFAWTLLAALVEDVDVATVPAETTAAASADRSAPGTATEPAAGATQTTITVLAATEPGAPS